MAITTTITTFFNSIHSDNRIQPTHVCIYLLLHHYWNHNGFQNPINISRSDIMKKTRISSNATYHKCIKELQALGYIIYQPSYHPRQGSKVFVVNSEKHNEN